MAWQGQGGSSASSAGGHHHALHRLTSPHTLPPTPPPLRQELRLGDLRHVAVLGAGAFGRVTLVAYEGQHYALKALSKAHVVQTGLQEHIKRERALMADFASPFLVHLVAAFQVPVGVCAGGVGLGGGRGWVDVWGEGAKRGMTLVCHCTAAVPHCTALYRPVPPRRTPPASTW